MSRAPDDREGLSPSPLTAAQLAELWEDDEDDDGIEYEPASENSENTWGTAEEEDDENEYLDAEDGLSGVDIEFSIEGDPDATGDNEDEGEQTETEGAPRREQATTRLTIAEINQVLGAHGPLRRLLMTHYRLTNPRTRDTDSDDEEQIGGYGGFAPRRRRKRIPSSERFPKIPSEAGKALMSSGVYGSSPHFTDTRRSRKQSLSEKLMYRRLGICARSSTQRDNRLLTQDLLPINDRADKIIHYDSRAYSGQFSDDGNFFFSCTQNFKVRMYDTSNPYEWKYYKTVDYPFGQWTITDATLSPDNRFLAYSSIRHVVCLAPTDPADTSDPHSLDFTNFARGAIAGRSNSGFGYMGRNGFGIWSLRFSGDGREIVCGTSDHCVVVYDVERRQSVLKLQNHEDDVNAVCFADTSSPHILYSGSDDQTLRVWDRRSMADGREAGVFVGHTEGLTYVDSKGDGRYVLSNGKDQMMKLWDLRKMASTADFDRMDLKAYTTNFDYRFSPYDGDDYSPNPHDCSVVTFRGHSVLKTLIRCHFSPPGSSNSRYVYSGSEDGKVWVYNMDATVAGTVDVGEATRGTRPRLGVGGEYGYEMHGRHGSGWKTCVRDASWNPKAPVLAATSWNGYGMSTGTVTLHSWNDGAPDDEADPPMATNYNCRLDVKEDYNANARARQQARSREEGRGLRSTVVRPARLGMDEEEDAGW